MFLRLMSRYHQPGIIMPCVCRCDFRCGTLSRGVGLKQRNASCVAEVRARAAAYDCKTCFLKNVWPVEGVSKFSARSDQVQRKVTGDAVEQSRL